MHLTEFQAWFEVFTEEMKGPPNKDQWAKIKKRVKEITADFTPTTIFVDRYVRPWRRYWNDEWISWGSLASLSPAHRPSTDDWNHAGRAEYRSQ